MKQILKKILLLLTFAVMGFPCYAGKGLGSYPCPTFNLKRHQFGVGLSSALCDNMLGVNQYLVQGWEYWGAGGFHINTHHSSFFSLFFNYQYRINDTWSVETRLKYKRRYTEMAMSYTANGSEGTIGSIIFSFHDLAIPITCNYRWVTRAGSSIEPFAGVGLTTLGLAGEQSYVFHYNDMENTHGELGIEYDRRIDVFGIVGIQFEIPYGAFVLKPFVSYSFSPIGHARGTVTPAGETSIIPGTITSTSMHLSELEVGIALQF